ncbi:MAG: amidohydrolase family protein [Bryobacteraceae bacterium]
MRIDCAAQLVDRSRFAHAWLDCAPEPLQRDFTIGALSAILSRNRFAGAVIVALLDHPPETDWLLRLAAEHPAMLAVMGYTDDPRDLDRWMTHPRFRGVRRRWSPGSAPWLAEVAGRGLRCDLEVEPGDIQRVEPLAGMALAHTGGAGFRPEGFEAWARAIEKWPGMVKADALISGFGEGEWTGEAMRPWIGHLVRTLGPERVMYGSDWPRCMRSGIWKESLAAFTQGHGALAMEVRSLLLGENAARHYGIGGGSE